MQFAETKPLTTHRFLYFLKIFLALIVFISLSCDNKKNVNLLCEEGVSQELATYRSKQVSDLSYQLYFYIPENKTDTVSGKVNIAFAQSSKQDIIIDFWAPESNIISVKCNEAICNYSFTNEHIIIDKKLSNKGYNNIEIEFVATNRALNRRDEFMYTLLVPDRARTLFPLFDQPDLKAKYTLSLSIPNNWIAIANGKEDVNKNADNSQINKASEHKTVYFEQTKPISSYLFSFVAGEFDEVSKTRNGEVHKIYHREKDSSNIKQFDDIFAELFHSLDWIEDYTRIPYPFAKYDMVLIPGFQYGGMEHVGSTLYNASIMFLPKSPTINQRISRAKLIAHETAHMWFGDLVTMKWFNDVWTKEVFANYFAAKIVTPLFPELDEKQSMLNYFSAAYSEDRTIGATSIKQELDNMKFAGLIYNSIIYNKSPIILNMISQKLGQELFRNAICDVLKNYSYQSATWEDWVKVFDKYSDENITEWSQNWMYKNGMPQINYSLSDSVLSINQVDNKGRGLIWKQNLNFVAISDQGNREEKNIYLDSANKNIEFSFAPKFILPNSDGNGYGFFKMDKSSAEYLIKDFKNLSSSIQKRMILINLYDNLIQNNELDIEFFINQMLQNLECENDPLIYSSTLNYISTLYKYYLEQRNGEQSYIRLSAKLDKELWKLFNTADNRGIKSSIFNVIYTLKISDDTKEKLYGIWNKSEKLKGVELGIRDYINLSYHLALVYQEKSSDIIEKQSSMIKNEDMLQEYLFVSKALSANKTERDAFFASLLKKENREVERWVGTSLRFLTEYRPKSQNDIENQESVEYIIPALNILPEIQRTGDIFFPQAWCNSLLAAYKSKEAYNCVQSYLQNTPQLHPLLKSKLLIASDHLYKLHCNSY